MISSEIRTSFQPQMFDKPSSSMSNGAIFVFPIGFYLESISLEEFILSNQVRYPTVSCGILGILRYPDWFEGSV